MLSFVDCSCIYTQLFSFDDFDIMCCSFNRVCYHSSLVVAYKLSYLALMILTLCVVVSIEYVISYLALMILTLCVVVSIEYVIIRRL